MKLSLGLLDDETTAIKLVKNVKMFYVAICSQLTPLATGLIVCFAAPA